MLIMLMVHKFFCTIFPFLPHCVMHVQCWAEICTLEFIFFLNWYIIDSFVHEWIVDFGKAKKIIAHLFDICTYLNIPRLLIFFFVEIFSLKQMIMNETSEMKWQWNFRKKILPGKKCAWFEKCKTKSCHSFCT